MLPWWKGASDFQKARKTVRKSTKRVKRTSVLLVVQYPMVCEIFWTMTYLAQARH